MKKIILLVLVILNGIELSAKDSGGEPIVPLTINQFDSVFFDLSLAVINGSSVEFPVYLKSDDVINSLDFQFKYDHSHLEYDTILNLTAYIEPLSYYNVNDSTVRLTSYSFTQPYSNDTPLVIVRFTLLSGQLCESDLNSVSSLLNGDAASSKVENCQTSGISEYYEMHTIRLFPNPASGWISIEVPEKAEIAIMDISSKRVIAYSFADAGVPRIINTEDVPNGIYLLKVTGSNFETIEKLVISK